jgi:hypothetical protein
MFTTRNCQDTNSSKRRRRRSFITPSMVELASASTHGANVLNQGCRQAIEFNIWDKFSSITLNHRDEMHMDESMDEIILRKGNPCKERTAIGRRIRTT